jgi:hypothetical protein
MNQNFTEKLASTRDKESLIQLMNELDEEKRRIKTVMGKFSNEDAENGGLTGKERQTKLRRMKTRLSFLIEEREAARQKLGKLNGDKKSLNKAMNRKIEFCHAFVAIAEREMSEEKFLDLEMKAMELLMAYPANT